MNLFRERIGVRCFAGARWCLNSSLIIAGLYGTFFASAAASAQLTEDDISALRRRGEAEGWTFSVGEGEATRRPLHELCGAVEPPDWRLRGRFDPLPEKRTLPAAFDWRDFNACTPVRNQGGCGSCWAFGAIGTVESAILLNDRLSKDLSEQWLVSCTSAGTCAGGWHSDSYEYLRCGGWQDQCGDSGAVMEADFPYVASDAPCGCPYAHPYCLDDWAFIGPEWGVPTVNQIKQAILDHGPVSACVYVNSAFQAYGGGVFNACENSWINHVVVLVGWDDAQGPSGVWILRNSWGPGWGEDGYMRIAYGCSRIGYASAYVEYHAWDCNGNGIADEQDIAQGTSADTNGNGVPDECECPLVSMPPQSEFPPVAKNRYLTFAPDDPGTQTALRVRLVALPPAFSSLEGTYMWVDEPQEVTEDPGSSGSDPPTFKIAGLTCAPVYRDWGATGLVYVYGAAIVPGATYEVQAINQACSLVGGPNYSAPLEITTSLWGDVVGDCAEAPCSPPNGDSNFDDIAAIVDKFRNLPGAPTKARVDLGDDPPDAVVNFTDISYSVEAFRGLGYPFGGPTGCP